MAKQRQTVKLHGAAATKIVAKAKLAKVRRYARSRKA